MAGGNDTVGADLGLLGDVQQNLKYLSEVEALAEEILVDRSEIVSLDRRRNEVREGLRALARRDPGEKVWVSVGSVLTRLPASEAKQFLQKDQVQLDVQVNKLRSDLKVKVNSLRDLEFQPPVPGLMLKSLSRDEMSAVNQVLSGKSS
ncbi:p53 and DNA damage-regulated protein 1 isoform X2 [Bacillus rossius redtenbacheri]|uniref:p53 and DNA damage-regulated protein 1 isoform X2 n=1 Tax=Bacillus rossius redtenbacheri TaxID=93214 RepID=UPI002FDE7C1C